MNEFVSWCRHLLVSFLFHALTSLHPPSFYRNDFSTCTMDVYCHAIFLSLSVLVLLWPARLWACRAGAGMARERMMRARCLIRMRTYFLRYLSGGRHREYHLFSHDVYTGGRSSQQNEVFSSNTTVCGISGADLGRSSNHQNWLVVFVASQIISAKLHSLLANPQL